MHPLQQEIERLYELGLRVSLEPAARDAFLKFREVLSRGQVRAAEKRDGRWVANPWVKQGILLGFRLGMLAQFEACGSC
jgi:2,3,4,5-tetrahydropyridine-2-carboxylate N-succinyltransferase